MGIEFVVLIGYAIMAYALAIRNAITHFQGALLDFYSTLPFGDSVTVAFYTWVKMAFACIAAVVTIGSAPILSGIALAILLLWLLASIVDAVVGGKFYVRMAQLSGARTATAILEVGLLCLILFA